MLDFLGRLRRSEHSYCQENLSSYLDGELSPRARERVDRHLAECERCRWDLETLQRTVGLLRAMPRPKAPRSFAILETMPAPALPFWMRPGVYTALRAATATAALFFVMTVAGTVLSVPMQSRAPAGAAPMLAAAKAAATAPAAMPLPATAAQNAEALPNGTPAAPKFGAGAATPSAAPAAAAAAEAPVSPAPGEPTLTAEEATRRAGAPLGKGGGSLPGPTADLAGTAAPPSVAAQPTPEEATGRGTPSEATPTPLEVARALSVPQEESTARAGDVSGPDRGQASATAAASVSLEAQPGAPDASREARLRLVAFPWQTLLVATAGVLAALVAATLWLRSARSRWP